VTVRGGCKVMREHIKIEGYLWCEKFRLSREVNPRKKEIEYGIDCVRTPALGREVSE
jgi:hypothetical protein